MTSAMCLVKIEKRGDSMIGPWGIPEKTENSTDQKIPYEKIVNIISKKTSKK